MGSPIVRSITIAALFVAAMMATISDAQTLTGVVSRKVHSGAGTFDLPIDRTQTISGAVTVEPRAIGSGHLLVFQFDNNPPVTSVGAATAIDSFGNPVGTVSSLSFTATEVLVGLTGIPNNSRASVSVTGINGAISAAVSVGFLLGDVDGSRVVDATDVSAIKARSGATAALTSANSDINATGLVNAADISGARRAASMTPSGFSLPAANLASLSVVKVGSGSGSIAGAGIACGSTCAVNLAQSVGVTLTATPNVGSTFSGWSGDCSGVSASFAFTFSRTTACTASFSVSTISVTPSAGANGSISPSTVQNINYNATTTFTVTPSAGFTAVMGGTCGGALVGNTYTTNPITSACTVTATFSSVSYAVTPSAGANGVITPSSVQSVLSGTTTTFTVSPNANYTPSVGGTCGGNLVGLTYTTNPIVAACTVVASFVRNSYTVTPSAGVNGTISPTTPQSVLSGATKSFSVTPAAGYSVVMSGTCGGTLTGTTYKTSPITGNCSVIASFASTSPKYVSTSGSDTTGDGSINNPWKTIAKGISTMVTGETLIVKGGVYSGAQNFINFVPSGTAAKYTTIAAETPMQARIQSTGTLSVADNQLNLTGNYIKVDGFIFDMSGTTNPAFIGDISGNFNTVSRSIFKRGGDIDSSGGLLSVTGSDNLFEDLAGTGACAICFRQGGPTATTQRNIWRRVIGRFDYSNSTQAKATFATIGGAVAGNVKDHLYQNVIAIDGQNPGNLGGLEKMGGFYAAQNTGNITLQGSMVLNEGAGSAGAFLRELGSVNNASHSVVWDLRNALPGAIGLIGGNADHLTIGGTVPGGAVDLITSATTSLLSPGTNPANLLNNTPGAVLLKQYGASGTRWGQTGYDQITTVDLWPWPYQDIIKSVFREANNVPAGNSPTMNDTFRGFADSTGTALYGGPKTLTSYVWEYLGAPCPPSACVTYVVTPSAGSGGTISPAIPQTVLPGAILTYTVIPSGNFTVAGVGGTCGGTLVGTTYTTNPISASCSVTASFAAPGAPVVLYTDITSGPNTGGENNKGIYLSIFGKNFGNSGLGTNTKVFINNVEVDNYRYLGPSRGRTDIQQITVQIGSLGNPVAGVPLPVKVVVGGTDSNTDQTFVVNPGTIYFVSLTGNDSTGVPGSISSPYRTVQRDNTINNNGSAGCPIGAGMQTVAAAGVWGLVRPGDFIVMRGGTWTDVSKDGFFLRTQNKAGTAATGAIDTGPITLMGYPGETAFINRTNTVNRAIGGGISSADTARHQLGCGSHITIANVKVESGFNDGMITTQAAAFNPSGAYWRVVNSEMSAVSCQINDNCKGAGVSGSGLGNVWLGNYVHDVYDMPGNSTDLENHGFYMDGIGSYEVAYNRIENIYGGNGIQTNSTTTAITNNAHIHHNLIHNVAKHGINLSSGAADGILVYNNVVYDTDYSGLRFNTTDLTGAKVYNNTFVNTDRLNGFSAFRAALANDWNIPTGGVEIRNNIFVPGSASRYFEGGSVGFAAVANLMSNNLWFNGTGGQSGSSNVLADPQFVSAATQNYRLLATSPGVNAGTSIVSPIVIDDWDIISSALIRNLRPVGAGFDIGAFER